MIYDLSNELGREQFKARCNQLYQQGGLVELTSKKGIRSLNQNNYLHLILSYFALEYGERMEYIKVNFFKRTVNRDLFVRIKKDKILGDVEVLRSSADLSKDEMSLCIDRFRDFSVKEAGIYLPDATQDAMIGEMYRAVERGKQYI